MSLFSNFPPNIPREARILISPLDWGLGHATRCISIIGQLRDRLDARVTVAAAGPQQAVIRQAYPDLEYLELPSYQIRYNKNRTATIAGLVLSLPRMARVIRQEHYWLRQLCEGRQFDLIVSDNRYGLWHPQVYSVMITHQLLVKTPFGAAADRLVQRFLYHHINRFNECWVPDNQEEPSLAGELSHPRHLPRVPVTYIGPLGRLRATQPQKKTDLLAILSGPEPQRSILEQKLLESWKQYPGHSMVLVRGLPGSPAEDPSSKPWPEKRVAGLTVYPYAGAEQLSQLVADAGYILCRSGYSSMMDLLPLGKKIVVVPTPGQTEQEYLARYLAGRGLVRAMNPDQLDLSFLRT